MRENDSWRPNRYGILHVSKPSPDVSLHLNIVSRMWDSFKLTFAVSSRNRLKWLNSPVKATEYKRERELDNSEPVLVKDSRPENEDKDHQVFVSACAFVRRRAWQIVHLTVGSYRRVFRLSPPATVLSSQWWRYSALLRGTRYVITRSLVTIQDTCTKTCFFISIKYKTPATFIYKEK